jgi:hypothetical protein
MNRGSSSFPAIAVAARRSSLLILIGLLTAIPVFAGEKTPEPRDPRMRRIVAEFELAAAGVPRQFRADLARAVAKCGKDCDREAFARTLMKSATSSEQKMTALLQAAHRQLKERARSVKGPDGVLGAAGDLSRSVARLEMSSLRASTEMTESLSVLKGAGFGGEPLLTTLQLHVASLVYITPIDFGLILTSRNPVTSTGFVAISGSAPEGTAVTVVITCGGDQQTLHDVANGIGHWGVNATFTLSGPTTCTATATAGTGIQAGSITTEINFR